jgi:hypothetical protein
MEAAMAVFTFTGDPNGGRDPQNSSIYGVSFEKGVPFSVGDEIAAKLRRHSHFTETGGAANLGDFDGDGKPGGTVIAATGIKAIHKGRGKWAVTDGETILADGLSKEDAQAKAAELQAA